MVSSNVQNKLSKKNLELRTATRLRDQFDSILKKFQREGTDVVKRYVGMEYLHFRRKLLPLVLQGLFRLSKQMVASRRPQFQVNMILDVASLKPRTEDIPESDNDLAGYVLLLLLASPSSHVIAKYAGLDAITGQQDLFDIALMHQDACPVPNTADVARTPDSSETRSAQTDPTLAKTPVPDDSGANQTHRSSAPSHDAPTDDDANKPADGDSPYKNFQENNAFNYTPPNSQPETGGTVLPPTVLIGKRFFPLPSPPGWDIAQEIALLLEPIANHITMGQRIALARRMTKSRCLVAAKELNIKRDTFAATNSVNDIIAKSEVNSSRVLAILTTWRCTFFEQLTKRLDRQLERRMIKTHPRPDPGPNTFTPTTSFTTNPSVVNLTHDDTSSEISPTKKRKTHSSLQSFASRAQNSQDDETSNEASPPKQRRQTSSLKSSASRAKKAQDGAATATTPSSYAKQHRAKKSLSFQQKKPPPTTTTPPHSSNESEEGTNQSKPQQRRQHTQQRKKRKGQQQQQRHHRKDQRRGQPKRDS